MSMYSKSELENIEDKIILNILKDNDLLKVTEQILTMC